VVADTGFSRVLKVSLDGQTLATIGDKGDGPGLFTEPASAWESHRGICSWPI